MGMDKEIEEGIQGAEEEVYKRTGISCTGFR